MTIYCEAGFTHSHCWWIKLIRFSVLDISSACLTVIFFLRFFFVFSPITVRKIIEIANFIIGQLTQLHITIFYFTHTHMLTLFECVYMHAHKITIIDKQRKP